VNETSFVDAASLDLAEPLPFQRHEAQRPAPAAEAVAAEGAHLVGGTAFVPALDEDEAPDARSEAQPAPAELSLEQVVALFVDVADDASSREATMQRYGLSDSADLDRLRAQWNERRRQSADIRASWQSAHATYTAWKKQRG
jgi:hypothetical protein